MFLRGEIFSRGATHIGVNNSSINNTHLFINL